MVGKKLTHKIFGAGTVKSLNEAEGSIVVEFNKEHTNPQIKRTQTLTFPYPGSFVQHLTAEDEETQKAVLAMIGTKQTDTGGEQDA
jgi:hypothetical protein